jgi:cytochrome c oxidase cbb3-type subunit III
VPNDTLTRGRSVLLIRINLACQEPSAADRDPSPFKNFAVQLLLSDPADPILMINACKDILGTLGWRVVTAGIALSVALSVSPIEEGSARLANGIPPRQSIADGRQFFENRCAGCHGIDGRGGERAPDIATAPKVQQRSDSALEEVITNGIPSRGMPAFRTIDAPTTRALIQYVRFLQGKTGSASLPGNPQNGKAIFFGSARCAECHLIRGAGGFIASDLSSYGQGRPVEEIRDAITRPAQPSNTMRGVLRIETRSGQSLTGVLRNEDNFSLQLQSLDGAFHSIMKADVANLTRSANSLMPADYGSTLNATQLNDLVSFLISVAQDDRSGGDPKKKVEAGDEEE